MSVGSRSVSPEPTREDQGTPAVYDHRVVVDGVNLQYLEAGSGPPLLLVHGHEQSAASWRWVIPVLARTHRVLALSLPGHGDSAPAVGEFRQRLVKHRTSADVRAFVGSVRESRLWKPADQ